MDKPTLSPQSNKLLDMCAGLLEGKLNPDDLWNFMEEIYESLDKARIEFIEQIDKQGIEFKEKIKHETDLVLSSFDSYLEGLDMISAYYQSSNSEDIHQGMKMIISSTEDMLNRLTAYETRSLQIGPTSFPVLNMLIMLSEGFRNGSVTKQDFRFMINNTNIFFNKMIKEAESYKGTEGRDAINMLREGYYSFLEGLKLLDEGAENNNTNLIKEGLKIIESSQEVISEGYEAYNEEMFLNGPTDSPVTNLLISTIKGVREGSFPRELLAENVERYQQHIDAIKAEFEAASGIPLDEVIEEEIARTLNASEISDEACEEIRDFLQNGNPHLLERAFEKLTRSAEIFREASDILNSLGNRDGKITCLKCGTLNEAANNNCVKCKSVLTKIPGQDSSTFIVGENGELLLEDENEFIMTENVYILLEGAEKVINGKAPFEDFVPVLDWMEELLNATYEESRKVPTVGFDEVFGLNTPVFQHYRKLAVDTIGLLQIGLDEFLDAIREMRQFQHDGDKIHFRNGIKGVLEASKKLQFVQKIEDLAAKSGEYDSVENIQYETAEEDNEDVEAAGQTDSFLSMPDMFK
jgi:hypothetical protein